MERGGLYPVNVARATALRPRPRGWGPGTSAIVLALVGADEPRTQVELAALVGVSQPRVSQVLKMLARSRAVRSRAGGYLGQPGRLLDLYVSHHRPRLAAAQQPWYNVRPLREQVDRVLDAARREGVRVAISADVGPDLLVPWRHPTLAVVYADRPLDLSADAFVAAEGRVDATVLIRVTSDTTLLSPFTPWPLSADGVPLTDPVQQLWDLVDLGGEDRREGADRLRETILERRVAAPA